MLTWLIIWFVFSGLVWCGLVWFPIIIDVLRYGWVIGLWLFMLFVYCGFSLLVVCCVFDSLWWFAVEVCLRYELFAGWLLVGLWSFGCFHLFDCRLGFDNWFGFGCFMCVCFGVFLFNLLFLDIITLGCFKVWCDLGGWCVGAILSCFKVGGFVLVVLWVWFWVALWLASVCRLAFRGGFRGWVLGVSCVIPRFRGVLVTDRGWYNIVCAGILVLFGCFRGDLSGDLSVFPVRFGVFFRAFVCADGFYSVLGGVWV